MSGLIGLNAEPFHFMNHQNLDPISTIHFSIIVEIIFHIVEPIQ